MRRTWFRKKNIGHWIWKLFLFLYKRRILTFDIFSLIFLVKLWCRSYSALILFSFFNEWYNLFFNSLIYELYRRFVQLWYFMTIQALNLGQLFQLIFILEININNANDAELVSALKFQIYFLFLMASWTLGPFWNLLKFLQLWNNVWMIHLIIQNFQTVKWKFDSI